MRMFPKTLLVIAVSFSALSGCKRAQHTIRHVASSEPDYTPQIQANVTTGHIDGLKYPDFTPVQADVSNFYNTREFDLAWVKNGKPTQQASALMEEFSNAAKRGLRPADYDAANWSTRVTNLNTPEGAALFDVAMTVTAIRYLNDVHMGRTIPTHFAFGVKGYDGKKMDMPTVLKDQVVDASDIKSAVDKFEPQSPQYKALKEALEHYQALAGQEQMAAGTGQASTLPEIDKAAKPTALNSGYAAMTVLAQRLGMLGDLPDGDRAPANADEVTEGLKKFQGRHGLTVTGKLSHDTVEALNTPMSTRVAQIEDSMERWRWLDDSYSNAAIVVNLPEFVLRAYEGTGSDYHEAFRMNVVDGNSDDETHHTPMIADMMKYLVFRPFWNVPPSIAKKEIIPHIEKSSGYLSAKNYETVDLKGKPAGADLKRIAQGTVMVRQKSGTSNSLGLVKFMFPNPFNVYLHDTNEKALFARTRRDNSHGCVRVQDPPKLADWVLRDNPKWDADSIAEAMNGGDDNKSVSLPKPVPVLIFYGTAWAEGGEMHFFKDMYGYDAEMERSLDGGRPYSSKPEKAVTEKDV